VHARNTILRSGCALLSNWLGIDEKGNSGIWNGEKAALSHRRAMPKSSSVNDPCSRGKKFPLARTSNMYIKQVCDYQ
jgi:hypothetical protein